MEWFNNLSNTNTKLVIVGLVMLATAYRVLFVSSPLAQLTEWLVFVGSLWGANVYQYRVRARERTKARVALAPANAGTGTDDDGPSAEGSPPDDVPAITSTPDTSVTASVPPRDRRAAPSGIRIPSQPRPAAPAVAADGLPVAGLVEPSPNDAVGGVL